MFYSLISGIYSYFFPEPVPQKPQHERKETVESQMLMDRSAIVLQTFNDEKESIKLAKQNHMEVNAYRMNFMYECAFCNKYRFPENISFIYKPVATKLENDPNTPMLYCCKDDESCLEDSRVLVSRFL